MKTTTLTTEQTKELNKLYKKYADCEEKMTFTHGDYDCNRQQKAATTRAYNKLTSYIESVTTEPAHQIIFRLVNP
jgi:hypothetical protein